MSDKMNVVDRSDRILDRKIMIYPEDESEVTLRMANWDAADASHSLISLKSKSKSGVVDGEMELSFMETLKGEGKMAFSYKGDGEKLTANTDYTTTKEGNKETEKYKFVVQADENGEK